MKLLFESWRGFLKEEEEIDIPTSRFSPPDRPLSVMTLYPGHEMYPSVKNLFAKDALGYGFAMLEHDMIIIDGATESESWYTEEHQLAIEAHEAAHLLLGHKLAGRDPVQEREADEYAVEMLRERGYDVAAALLEKRLEDYDEPNQE